MFRLDFVRAFGHHASMQHYHPADIERTAALLASGFKKDWARLSEGEKEFFRDAIKKQLAYMEIKRWQFER